MIKGMDIGSLAEWFGAILSGVAIIMVVWQTNQSRKSDKELFIYTNNLEKLMRVRNAIDNVSFRIRWSLLAGKKNTDEILELNLDLHQVVNEISQIKLKALNQFEIHEKVLELEKALNQICLYHGKNFNCDAEEYAEGIKLYDDCSDIINSINEIILSAQNELLK